MQSLLVRYARGAREPEECEAVPARARDRNRDCAERGVMPVLTAESPGKDLDQNRPSFPLPAEHSTRKRQAAILLPTIPVPSRCLDPLAAYRKEVSRRDLAQVGIPRDLAG